MHATHARKAIGNVLMAPPASGACTELANPLAAPDTIVKKHRGNRHKDVTAIAAGKKRLADKNNKEARAAMALWQAGIDGCSRDMMPSLRSVEASICEAERKRGPLERGGVRDCTVRKRDPGEEGETSAR
eukprot:2230819-Pleurochrysis_carterae.AAC.2